MLKPRLRWNREVLCPSHGLRYDKTRVGEVGQDRCCGSENNLREGVGLTQGLPRKPRLLSNSWSFFFSLLSS